MTREEAIREWIFRSKHMKRWLYEYGEAAALRHYIELVDMAIEALQREEAEEKGYCHKIKPKQDLISRTKLFNKLATVQAPPEANEYKAEVYKIIQSMGTEENDEQ